MHNSSSMWDWGFGFEHWGIGVLIWVLVVFGIIVVAKNMLDK